MSNNFKALDIRVLGFIVAIVMGMTSACVPSLNLSGGGGQAERRSDPPSGANNNPKPPVNPNVPNPSPYPYQTVPPVMPTPNMASDCYKATPFVCKVEHLITEKTNKYRASVGKTPLTYDAKMAFVARDWSTKQGQSGSISHRGFPNSRQQVYQSEFNISEDFWAENVAMSGMSGGGGQSDADAESVAEDFTNMWWTSPGHRANMVGDYSKLGMGMAQDSSGSWYGTQIFQ